MPTSSTAAPPGCVALLGGTAPIVEHPEVSTTRALIRALRRTGDGAGAERLARRVACTGTGLVAWLAQLAQVEAGLGDDGGREAAAAGDPLFRAGLALQRLYPPAAASEDADVRVTLVAFNGELEVLRFAEPIAALQPLTAASYQPNGVTAMLDAVGTVLERLAREVPDDEETRYLVVIVTATVRRTPRGASTTRRSRR